MSVLDTFKAEAEKAVAETKSAVADKIAAKDAVIADLEKKLQDAAASAVSSDDLAWLESHVQAVKEIVPT